MCTSVIIGKQATTQGQSILARNEDFDTNIRNKYLKFREIPEYHQSGIDQDMPGIVQEGMWTLGNGLCVPVPEKQFSYSAMPDAEGNQEAPRAISDHFFYEARGINENNVALSATNSLEDCREKALAADPWVKQAIDECIIPTLILPQAESARQAISLLGQYVTQYGASAGNGILIGDTSESWYLEIASGHQWIAVKVPENSYLAVANGIRIHGVDLDAPDVLHSNALFEFVVQHDLLPTADRHHFDFAAAFGTPGDPNPYNVDRVWLIQHLLTPSLIQAPRQKQYPLFLQPDKKLDASDIMTVMRSNYQGTVLAEEADRPIGVIRTTESHIIELNPHLPEALQGLIWQSVSAPVNAPYLPLFQALKHYPDCYQCGDDTFTRQSAYWAFKGLTGLASLSTCHAERINARWYETEQQYLHEHRAITEMLCHIAETHPETATDSAAQYSSGILCHVYDQALAMQRELITSVTKHMEDPYEIRNE